MKKYLIYFNERFPLQTHIPIIAIFTFSAICFSLSAVEATNFIPWNHYFLALSLTFTIFLLLRISDEFKDHEEDMKYRKYLPVPRGIISLRELRNLGLLIFLFQLVILFFYPEFLIIYLITMVFMTLMFKEFFIPDWLKKHQLVYVFSHMAIIPLVDLVASSSHWSFEHINPPKALIWFFLVSFFNGVVLEFGRKIKTPDYEEEGVISYTKLFGTRNAVLVWLLILLITFLLAVKAAHYINSPIWVYILLSSFFFASIIPAILFIRNPSMKTAKMIEAFAGLWTLGMYLNIGALPFIIKNII